MGSVQKSCSYQLALDRQSLACTPVLYGPSPSVLPTEKTLGHCQGDPTEASSPSNILITVIDQELNSLISIAIKAHCIESGFPLCLLPINLTFGWTIKSSDLKQK